MQSRNEHDSLLVPPPFRLTSPYTAQLREGGGWMSLFGIPFLLAGIFLGANVVPALYKGLAGIARVQLVFSLMSLAFLVVGGVLVFGRRWVTLDRSNGSLLRATGLLIPMRTEHRHLSDFHAVVIAFDQGNSDTSDHYPVRLRAIAGRDFLIYSPTAFAEARKHAEFVSHHLRLPLADITTDHEVIVSADRATDTLQQRLRSGGSPSTLQAPPGMHCQVTRSSDETIIVIPRRKSVAVAWVISIILMLFVMPAIFRFFSQSETPVESRLLFTAMMFLFFGVAPWVAISVAFGGIRRKTVITTSRAGIVVERGCGWRRTQTTVVPADGIFDVDCSTVDGMLESARGSTAFRQTTSTSPSIAWSLAALKKYVPTKGIVVKSRQGMVTFGEGLAAEELQYLKWVLTKALVE
jgi:hypothetical protein